MDSCDSEKTGTTANDTQESRFLISPLDPSDDPTSLTRSPDRPPVPLSRLELLPTEIHIEIIKRAAVLTDSQGEFVGYDTLCKLARASPVFTQLAQAQLYHDVLLISGGMAQEWSESAATIRGEFATRTLQLGWMEGEEEERVNATLCEEVLAFQTSNLEDLILFGMRGVRSSSLNKLSGHPASHLIPS